MKAIGSRSSRRSLAAERVVPRDSIDPAACTADQAAVRERLAEARVGIVGAGGLGSNAALMLVRAGVRALTLADFDVVETSNLNRQMYFPDQLGRPKVQALAESLLRLEPDLDVRLVYECITSDNLAPLFGDVDVLIEAVDTAEGKAMLVETACDQLPATPFVWASGLAGCGSANEIITRRVGEHVWVVGDLEADVRDGLPLLASRVMVASAHQAQMAIRILLGLTEP